METELLLAAATLPQALEQIEALTGQMPEKIIADRGYRGQPSIGNTQIITLQPFHPGLSQ